MSLLQEKIYTEADYYNLPENVRAELIDGHFYYQAAPSRVHQTVLSELHAVIHSYLKSKGGPCRVYPAPFAVKLFNDSKTIVEPDLSIICDYNKLTERGCSGSPDWIIEILSPSNPGHDLIYKLNLYANAKVREYWIVDPQNEKVFVYYLEQKDFGVEVHSFQEKVNVNIYTDFTIDFSDLDL